MTRPERIAVAETAWEELFDEALPSHDRPASESGHASKPAPVEPVGVRTRDRMAEVDRLLDDLDRLADAAFEKSRTVADEAADHAAYIAELRPPGQ